ncbi:hypothetical protein E4U11_003400 [Claviceps purpurea]|nr:hypothetical protein E4U11_003400 [Claviceps purpurea]
MERNTGNGTGSSKGPSPHEKAVFSVLMQHSALSFISAILRLLIRPSIASARDKAARGRRRRAATSMWQDIISTTTLQYVLMTHELTILRYRRSISAATIGGATRGHTNIPTFVRGLTQLPTTSQIPIISAKGTTLVRSIACYVHPQKAQN